MRLFETDEKRPGTRILIVGAIAYGAVVLISLAFFIAKHSQSWGALWVLLATPLLLGGFSAAMSPGILFYGLIAGVPGISIVYGFGAAKRNWRGILGGLLLASAILGAGHAFFNIR